MNRDAVEKGPRAANGGSKVEAGAEPGTEYGRGRVRGREPLWTVKDVAQYLRVSTKTVRRLEARGLIVRCTGLGGMVRFRSSDVSRLASVS